MCHTSSLCQQHVAQLKEKQKILNKLLLNEITIDKEKQKQLRHRNTVSDRDQRTKVTLSDKMPSEEGASAFPSAKPLEAPDHQATSEPRTSSGPNAEGHWNFVQLPPYTLYQTPCFKLFYPLTHPTSHTVSNSLHSFKGETPPRSSSTSTAQLLPWLIQATLPAPRSLTHSPVQGSFFQEAFWASLAKHIHL